MATPSGNSPSFPASTQGNGKNNKRKLEDYPPTYEQYLQLKKGFLNSHARVCDICRSLIYGSRKESQLDHASDSNLNSLIEAQVGNMILGHLDVIYRKIIIDLSSKYGYPEVDATTAVLATGICYGCKDPIGNALKHALTFLNCGLRVDNPKRQNFSEDLKTLVKFVSMIVYDGWRKKYPYLCLDDFLLWLLVYGLGPSNASTLAGFPFGTFRSHKVSSSSTCLQWKEESTSNSRPTIQFMPMAGVTEDDNLDASSPYSENAYEPKLTAVTGIPRLASGRFTARTSLSLPDSNPNAKEKNPMSPSDSLADKISSLTISESSIPEEMSVHANTKDANSRRDFAHRRPKRRCQARVVGMARKLVTTKSTMLDSNRSLPKPDKQVGLESSQSSGTKDFSFDSRSFACSSVSMNIVNTTTSLSHAANVDAFTSIPSKSSSDEASFKPDDYSTAASIPYVLEKLLSRNKDLQLQLQYWTNWAHHKVLRTTNKLNQDKAELQRLRQEKLEAKKEKEAFANSTMKKIGEVDKSLSSTKIDVEAARAALCMLELENISLEEKLEAAKVRASESAASYEETSLKKITTLKKSQTCERERTLFQEELASDNRVLSQLQKQLQQAHMSHDQLEVKRIQEETLKSKELITVLNERKEHEQLEASLKSKKDMIRLKNKRDLQSCIDHIRSLRRQTTEQKLMVDSSNFARLDWAQSAYFTTDKMGLKESRIREALAELLDEENIQIPSWICFSSIDGEHPSSGESFKECLDILNRSEKISVVGINCASPQIIENLILEFRKLTKKAVAVYPNSGEVWDGRAKRWLPSECFGDHSFEMLAKRWRDSGASLIGGCCRTTPSTIQAISRVLKNKS